MSNFLKKGKRKQIIADKKMVKSRMKEIYAILNDLTTVAETMYQEKVPYTEDNIEEVASKYTDRKLGAFEKFILLGKLNSFENEDKGHI